MFIEKSDLKGSIRLEYIDQISREDETIVTGAIASSIIEMKGYLSSRFNVDSIFSQDGENRDQLLIALLSDMVIYELIDIIPAGIDIDDRRARYKRAITWLEDVQAGTINADLPKLVDDENNPTTNKVEYSSNPKRKNIL